jgi:hypothetical protein
MFCEAGEEEGEKFCELRVRERCAQSRVGLEKAWVREDM